MWKLKKRKENTVIKQKELRKNLLTWIPTQAKLKEVPVFVNQMKKSWNSMYIHNKPKSISKKVKNEFGNSSHLQAMDLFAKQLQHLILRKLLTEPIFKINSLNLFSIEPIFNYCKY